MQSLRCLVIFTTYFFLPQFLHNSLVLPVAQKNSSGTEHFLKKGIRWLDMLWAWRIQHPGFNTLMVLGWTRRSSSFIASLLRWESEAEVAGQSSLCREKAEDNSCPVPGQEDETLWRGSNPAPLTLIQTGNPHPEQYMLSHSFHEWTRWWQLQNPQRP